MRRLLQRLRPRRPEPEIECRLGGVDILLPPGHKLPVYQALHPRYDRFLPHLAALLPDGSTVIDVGANCGDTVAAMAGAHAGLHYVCIEPDGDFFAYLQKNLERLRAARPGLQAQAVQAMVGKEVTSAALAGSGGTKHALPGAGGQATRTLDEIMAALGTPPVSLLKSDVDGFDHDVIGSAAGLLARDRPLLFFECHPADAAQRAGYARLLAELPQAGYVHWTVFDNFGEVMLADATPQAILQLLEYVARQTARPQPPTVYYVDVLAAGERDTALARRAVEHY